MCRMGIHETEMLCIDTMYSSEGVRMGIPVGCAYNFDLNIMSKQSQAEEQVTINAYQRYQNQLKAQKIRIA